MSTMLFADEVVDPDTIDDIPRDGEVSATDRELDIAKQLVDSLAGEFEPEQYRDTYREEVLALIERKAAGEEVAVQPAKEEEAAPVPDLMSALKASLDAVRERDAEGDGAARSKKAPAKKSTSKRSSSGAKSSSRPKAKK